VEKSANTNWIKLTARTREQARGAYGRELCLSHWICYVHSHLLAKIWHTAQDFPALRECVWQLMSAVAWYIWLGATFIISTLQCKKGPSFSAECGPKAKESGQRRQRGFSTGIYQGPERTPMWGGYQGRCMYAQCPITMHLHRHSECIFPRTQLMAMHNTIMTNNTNGAPSSETHMQLYCIN